MFSELGTAASTEEVARRAGLAVGTVFRHFPTKQDLVAAITEDRLARLLAQLDALDRTPGRGTALFTFFERMVEQAAMKRRVADLLDREGVEVGLADAVQRLDHAVERLLGHAHRAGTVARQVELPQVMALLTSLCQGALAGGWDAEQQARVLAIVFAGLRTPDDRRS
ncbi:TetR/AcrR family transcriptional regulator [Dactylosporangium sp. NPDC051541]|uniref:TetR/AcrR family transcriptional regulator n=1 Tax=Dactylosporangium sp. NPDC051541 TaxID=3363977 RepID=UPI003789D8FC